MSKEKIKKILSQDNYRVEKGKVLRLDIINEKWKEVPVFQGKIVLVKNGDTPEPFLWNDVKEVLIEAKQIDGAAKKKEIPDDVGWVDDAGREAAKKDGFVLGRDDWDKMGDAPKSTFESFAGKRESSDEEKKEDAEIIKSLGDALKHEISDVVVGGILIKKGTNAHIIPENSSPLVDKIEIKHRRADRKEMRAFQAINEILKSTENMPKNKPVAKKKKVVKVKTSPNPKKSVKSPKNGQKSNAGRKKGVKNKNVLTEKDVKFILDNKKTMSKMAIARKLGVSRFNVMYVVKQDSNGKKLRSAK